MTHQPTQTLPFFVFGTLRPGCGNDRRWHGMADARHDGAASLADHRLVSNGSFPYCLPAAGEVAIGTLIYPDEGWFPIVLRQLDALEGVPHHYNRRPIVVDTPDGEVRAWYYIPDNWERYESFAPVPMNDWSHHRRPDRRQSLTWTSELDFRESQATDFWEVER